MAGPKPDPVFWGPGGPPMGPGGVMPPGMPAPGFAHQGGQVIPSPGFEGGNAWRQPPGPFPANKFDPEALWKNEPHTVPGPLATESRGHWTRGPEPISFRDRSGEGVGIVAEALYTTPVFDLRPDLRGSQGVAPGDTQPIYRGAYFGAGSILAVKLTGDIQNIGVDMRVLSYESGDPITPDRVNQYQQQQDVSSDFWDGNDSVIFYWSPPGSPIRYWRVFLRILTTSGAFGDRPNLVAVGAMY